MALYAFDGTGQNDNNNPPTIGPRLPAKRTSTDSSAPTAKKRTTGPLGHTCEYRAGRRHKVRLCRQSHWRCIWRRVAVPDQLGEWAECAGHAYEAGDTNIDVIGFSRGAAIALDFVNKVSKEGVEGSTGKVPRTPNRRRFRFVGLVRRRRRRSASPTSDCCSRQDFNPLHHLTLPDNVENCYHAMSLDERRT